MAQAYKEAFIGDIKDNLFQGAEFVNLAVNHDGFVQNKKVHVPQAGTPTGVTVDRSSLPITATQRTDDELVYTLQEFSTDLIAIPNIEKIQLVPDKRMSIMGDFIGALNERIGTNGAWNLASTAIGGTSSLTLRTGLNGTVTADKKAVALYPSLVGNGTGFRYSIGLGDFATAAAKLDRDNVPQGERYALLPVDMYWDFIQNNMSVLGSSLYNPDTNAIVSGAVRKVYGFNIVLRPTVSVFADSGPTLAAVNAATVATSCLGAFFWQKNSVAKALGAIKFFADQDNAAYQGDIYSALVYFKNTTLRKDCKGVVNMVQYYSAS